MGNKKRSNRTTNRRRRTSHMGPAPRARDTVDETEETQGKSQTSEEATQKSANRVVRKTQPKQRDSLGHFLNDFNALGVAGVRREFAEEVESFAPPGLQSDAFRNNPDRNRFPDVPCLDQTRLVLDLNVPPDTDYVHANTVKMEGYDRVFVATQAPLQNTIQDFWRLVFQTQASSVAVLADPTLGQSGLVPYYPVQEGKYENYGEMFVNNRKVFVEDKFQCFMIEVLPEGCSNSLITKLVLFANWPERDVINRPRTVMRFTRLLPAGTCVITGCAGVGRPGVLMTIDFAMYKLVKKFEKPVVSQPFALSRSQVKELVKLVRSQRVGAVQSERQYMFIYYVILEYVQMKNEGTRLGPASVARDIIYKELFLKKE